MRSAASLNSASKPDKGALLLRSSLKLSVVSPDLKVPTLLRQIIHECVSDGITIRKRVQRFNENHSLHTRYPLLSATMSNSVSKCDRGTILLRSSALHSGEESGIVGNISCTTGVEQLLCYGEHNWHYGEQLLYYGEEIGIFGNLHNVKVDNVLHYQEQLLQVFVRPPSLPSSFPKIGKFAEPVGSGAVSVP